jgi:hypothetical protein
MSQFGMALFVPVCWFLLLCISLTLAFIFGDLFILEPVRLCYYFAATEPGRRQARCDFVWLARISLLLLSIGPMCWRQN